MLGWFVTNDRKEKLLIAYKLKWHSDVDVDSFF